MATKPMSERVGLYLAEHRWATNVLRVVSAGLVLAVPPFCVFLWIIDDGFTKLLVVWVLWELVKFARQWLRAEQVSHALKKLKRGQ